MFGRIADVWSLPGLKQVRKSGSLNSALRVGCGQFWGKFLSRPDAEQFLRSSKRVTYNNSEIVKINFDLFRRVQLFDWPVMYTLRELIYRDKLHTVVDFGGHVGAKYYAYRSMMPFPLELAWKVVDVPAVCEEGRRRLKRGDESLSYYDDIGKIDSCDALICAGSLQYCDFYLDHILKVMPHRPHTIILNRVAVSDEEFYTLEDFGVGRMPHRIVTKDVLENISETFGYTISTQWEIPDRDFIVHHRTGENLVRMVGQIWEKRSERVTAGEDLN
ncbi:methyltransferase, TIGR04325 family [Methylobacterium sp. DCY52]|uniref:methyltransferase, TIGR04325 family n=1 Tax=Methylobacterium sp. DCY52 TaxID=739139 RepID=UPI0031455E0C